MQTREANLCLRKGPLVLSLFLATLTLESAYGETEKQ